MDDPFYFIIPKEIMGKISSIPVTLNYSVSWRENIAMHSVVKELDRRFKMKHITFTRSKKMVII